MQSIQEISNRLVRKAHLGKLMRTLGHDFTRITLRPIMRELQRDSDRLMAMARAEEAALQRQLFAYGRSQLLELRKSFALFTDRLRNVELQADVILHWKP